MLDKRSLLIIGLMLWIASGVRAQGGNSPYSFLGVGKPVAKGNVINAGMGGMGVSYANGMYSNLINPANLTANKLTFFDAALMGEYKILESEGARQTDFGGNVAYLAFGFPITQHWTSAVGLRPVTTVNYEISVFEKLANRPTFVEYSLLGDGGITQVYFSNGLQIVKGLSVGLEMGYNFGAVNRQERSRLDDEASDYIIGLFERVSFSEFTFVPGIKYSLSVGENAYVNVGGTYQAKTDFGARKFQAIERRAASNEARLFSDTLQDVNGAVSMPSEINFGVSFEKTLKYAIGVDVTLQNWSEFRSFEGEQPLQDTYEIKLGGEYIPDITSVSSYFKRIAYRAGLNYKLLPYDFSGEQLQEYSINAGFSLPMSRGFSNMNLALSYGRIEGGNEAVINEEFFKFNFGLIINDRWFVRRRIN